MSVLTNDIQVHWTSIQPLLSIRNEREYDLAVEHMNQLLDEVGDNEEHPLYVLLDTLSTLISAYEEKKLSHAREQRSRHVALPDGRARIEAI